MLLWSQGNVQLQSAMSSAGEPAVSSVMMRSRNSPSGSWSWLAACCSRLRPTSTLSPRRSTSPSLQVWVDNRVQRFANSPSKTALTSHYFQNG